MQIGVSPAGRRPVAAPRVPVQALSTATSAPAPSVDRLTTSTPPAPVDTTGLTAEEINLQQQGLLPANFAALRQAQREGGKEAAMAIARAGLKGPFSRRFGDPDVMLEGARRLSKHPEYSQMAKMIQPGDILVTTWNKPEDVISKGTNGPFIHALICVEAGPPPTFIEAIGLSGDVRDPAGNKVLRSMLAEQGFSGQSIRLLRPTAALAPHEAEKAIKRAIAYAEGQLGKPYDFALTDINGQGMNDAFYCSELAYKAYATRQGADLPIPISKSSNRDQLLNALAGTLGGLKPDDQGSLTFQAAQLSATKGLTDAQIVDFIVDKVAAGTAATRPLADTPARKAALRASVEKLISGQATQGLDRALGAYTEGERSGSHRGVLGFFRKLYDGARVGVAGLSDVRALTKGIGFWRSLGVTWKLSKTVVPHAEVLTRFFFGEKDPRTVQARNTLDQLDGLARDMRRIPLVGRFWPLPSRPRPEVNRNFVSPSDLGWSNVAHWDFNVKPEWPLDQAAFEARQRR